MDLQNIIIIGVIVAVIGYFLLHKRKDKSSEGDNREEIAREFGEEEIMKKRKIEEEIKE